MSAGGVTPPVVRHLLLCEQIVDDLNTHTSTQSHGFVSRV